MTFEALPPAADLERICRGLAMLDAIRSDAWEARLYSFDSAWSEGQRMASMRNGQGDEWFFAFEDHHVFLKGFFHELPRADRAVVYAGCPQELAHHLDEAAFSMDDVTFGGFFAPERGWTLRGDVAAMSELAILTDDPEAYRVYAADYFEVALPLDAIAHVLAGKPLDDAILAELASERTLEELEADRREIGYP
jgi:hypothetical protein